MPHKDLELRRAHGAKYRALNRESLATQQRDWLRRLKIEVFNHYGGSKCQCGETRLAALTIDHINGGGAEHRRKECGNHLYKWLKRNGFPQGYRVLCANCNHLAYLKSITNRQLSTKASAKSGRKRRARAKLELMQLLGGQCRCGIEDIRILTVHHTDGNGAAHRQEVSMGKGSGRFYIAVLELGDLTGLECRCFSCNDSEDRIP
jgi:hypothetical protein